MKKVFLFAAAVAMLAACSSNDDLVKEDVKQDPQAQAEPGAIGFDVYTQKATTRAGWTGSLTTSKLQTNNATAYAEANGFGVFGFYTDNNEYEQRSVPNFMYNQQVTWNNTGDPSTSYWEYDPIMYWPNEYGSDATSDDADKVTFFAYAPYVWVIPTSGKVARTTTEPTADNTKELESYGITGMTRNSNQGDPILKYIASFDNKKSVDLCWGVAPETVWNTTQKGNNQSFEAGMPWLNVQRPAEATTQPAAEQRVKFIFKHATAQLQVFIDADIDINGHGHSTDVDKKSRVWVREVKFKGFAMKGSLNLDNEVPNDPKWLDYNGQNEIVAEDVTIYDGRKDGKEGVNGAVATNEKVLGLNPTLIQDGLYRDSGNKTVNETGHDVYNNDDAIKVLGVDNATERKGVTKNTVNLFENTNTTPGNDFFHVIPVDNERFEVEIVYDIETVDGSLAQNLSDGTTKGSSIENRIRKEISFGDDNCLRAGHSYKLNLHLGMYSVKFDAAVTEWIDVAAQDVDLPLNAPQYKAGATPDDAKYGDGTPSDDYIYLPYTAETNAYTLAITELNGGETVTAAKGDNVIAASGTVGGASNDYISGWNATSVNASKNGNAVVSVTTSENTSTCNRTQIVKWTGAQSGKGAIFTFTQRAHPLNLHVGTNYGDPNTVTASGSKITLKAFAALSFGWFCKGLADGCTALTYSTNGDPEASTPQNGIAVYRNGVKLTIAEVLSGDPKNKFTFSDISGDINFGDDLHAGDVYRIVLKTGDAPVETITVTVTE